MGGLIMRLWHYLLIPYLPDKQLRGQWNELNSIFKKQDDHILINYVYQYPKENLMWYTELVLKEMNKRGFNVKKVDNLLEYFKGVTLAKMDNPFPRHHNRRYLKQCFYNLQEKRDRAEEDIKHAKDFTIEQYLNLLQYVRGFELGNEL